MMLPDHKKELMSLDTFSQISRNFWDAYLKQVKNLEQTGNISQINFTKYGVQHQQAKILLYPTILLCTQTDDYFISELLGSQSSFDQLILKKHKTNSVDQYFYQFDIDDASTRIPAINFTSEHNLITGMCLSHTVDLDALYSRFPFITKFDGAKLVAVNGKGSLLTFQNKANFISFQNCTLINRYKSAIRIKNLKQVMIIHRSTSNYEYKQYLNSLNLENFIYGTTLASAHKEAEYQVAAQFVNFYLFPNLRETTIGEFFHTHPEFIKNAFCTSHFEYEPYFEWQEGLTDFQEQAINPDLIIQRPDGHYDIYDLKTALLSRSKLTKGRRSRRRFIDYIAEGAAQLAHYESYFTHPKNQDYAWAKYKISVNNPHLVLVVGNLENINRAHIDEAYRMLRNFEIIDYDIILHLYLNSNCKQIS